MKHLKLFEDYGEKITCEKCDHSWEIEEGDEHPYLCHTCGYDSEEGDFNYPELERFWSLHEED
jgi:hypothetical protein